MKAVLIKTERGLRGATTQDDTAFQKFKRRLETMRTGTWLRIEAAVPRNGKHHRKFIALLQLITENSEVYDTTAKALVAVKLVVGHFEPHIDPETGELHKVPLSIAYESMQQDEFDLFYKDAIDGICRFILPQLDEATAERLLEQIILGWD